MKNLFYSKEKKRTYLVSLFSAWFGCIIFGWIGCIIYKHLLNKRTNLNKEEKGQLMKYCWSKYCFFCSIFTLCYGMIKIIKGFYLAKYSGEFSHYMSEFISNYGNGGNAIINFLMVIISMSAFLYYSLANIERLKVKAVSTIGFIFLFQFLFFLPLNNDLEFENWSKNFLDYSLEKDPNIPYDYVEEYFRLSKKGKKQLYKEQGFFFNYGNTDEDMKKALMNAISIEIKKDEKKYFK